MNGNKLDEIDRKILNHLQGNARINFSKLCTIVGLSQTPMTERILKMEEAGVITGYFALLDRQKIGQPVLVNLFVKLQPQTAETLALFEQVAAQLLNVQALYVISGNWNFVLHITAQTPQEYFTFLMENISCLSYVGQTESAFVLREFKAFAPFAL